MTEIKSVRLNVSEMKHGAAAGLIGAEPSASRCVLCQQLTHDKAQL